MIEVLRVAAGTCRYDEVLDQLRAPDLRDRMWCDGEHRLEEHPDKTWWVVLADGRPAAWCAARPDGEVLRCTDNFEVPGTGRQLGLYRLAFLARHHDVVATAPYAVTYLFAGRVVDFHEAFGWAKTGATGPGELPGHIWWELRKQS